jgi:glycosyltransferase involved in cell wall biosynthesis
MTHVAYLVSDYSAPSHTFVRREVAALREVGLTVTPFSIQGSQQDSDVEAIFGRSVVSYPLALLIALGQRPQKFFSSWRLALRHRPPGLRGLVWSQFHFVEAMLLARLMKAAHCSRLHNHFANSAATVGLIAAHYLNIPWSFTLHGISETDYPAGILLGDKLERADFVACASYFMRAQAMRNVDVKHWHKMHIVHCGVDVDGMPVGADSTQDNGNSGMAQGSTAPSVRIITVGRLSAEKGYFGLLEVLARLNAKEAPFVATIVGDGPSGEAIHAKTRTLSLEHLVRFTGALSEQETLAEIQSHDVMVLPSLMEGLPVVLIEALAMRKAVVASQVAGIPELVCEGVTGLLFTPSDWDDLERQLSRLLANPELRTALGHEGFNRVKNEFGSAKAADLLSKLFKAKGP